MEFFNLFSTLEGSVLLLFIGCLLAVSVFEFINGFHDTANAVATVIYTKSLKPQQAVLLSGFLNFLGMVTSVYFFGMGVAVKMVKLLPMDKIADLSMQENIAIIAAVLLGAIIWNFGTWYFGIPCSSSHTMIGSLLGACIGFFLLHGDGWKDIVESKPFEKGIEVLRWMLVSPIIGFTLSISLVFIIRRLMRKKDLFKDNKEGTPPTGVRALLISTCSLVSFFHGSNDGQKGLGLVMVILMTFLPMQYALKGGFAQGNSSEHLKKIEHILSANNADEHYNKTLKTVAELQESIVRRDDTTKSGIFHIRKKLQSLDKDIESISKDADHLTSPLRADLKKENKALREYTDWAPNWALMLMALCIGCGTIIGWKRIVVTIGEKIGKSHLSYGQGAVSELVAASMIGVSTSFSLPVSTTHVLSSAVAGSMVAKGGIKNLQKGTITNIALAWILTLPATILLSLGLYLLFRLFA